MGLKLRKFKFLRAKRRKKQTLQSYKITIQSKGEVKPFQIRLPEGVKRVKCMFVFSQNPLSKLSTNFLLQEDGNAILDEDGNAILLE